jgi:uncharacterized integral membrane protein
VGDVTGNAAPAEPVAHDGSQGMVTEDLKSVVVISHNIQMNIMVPIHTKVTVYYIISVVTKMSILEICIFLQSFSWYFQTVLGIMGFFFSHVN